MKFFSKKTKGDKILTEIINLMEKYPQDFKFFGSSHFYSGDKIEWKLILVKNGKLILRRKNAGVKDNNEQYILSDNMLKIYSEL